MRKRSQESMFRARHALNTLRPFAIDIDRLTAMILSAEQICLKSVVCVVGFHFDFKAAWFARHESWSVQHSSIVILLERIADDALDDCGTRTTTERRHLHAIVFCRTTGLPIDSESPVL